MSRFRKLVEDAINKHWEIQPDMFGGEDEYFLHDQKALDFPTIRDFVVDNFPSFDLTDSKDNGIKETLVFQGRGKGEDLKKALEGKFGKDIKVRIGSYKYAPEIKNVAITYLMKPDDED